MHSLQNVGAPVLKNPPWDPVISLQSAWDFQGPFFNQISIFQPLMSTHFFLQNALPAKVEVGPGPFHKVALPQNDL